jgi:hypothetical protein
MSQKQQEELNAILVAIESEIDAIGKDMVYFISEYVYIEDKTSPTGICKFNLWPEQKRAIWEIEREQFLILLKARQLGMTCLVLAWVLWKLLTQKGYLVLVISKRDTPDAKELSNRMQVMLRHLPLWLIRSEKDKEGWNGLTWKANDHEAEIIRPDGEDSRLLMLSSSPDTAHSFTANVIILDEWAYHPDAEEIWTGAYPTINRADFSGKVIGLSTGKRNTLFEKMWNDAKKGINSFKTIFLPWWADPRRTKEWYEMSKANFPNKYRSQYPATEDDAFTVGEGAFFEEWDPSIHVPFPHWEPPRDHRWIIIGSYDPGFSTNACFKWYAVSPEGWVRCFKEYYPHKTIDTDQAKEILRLSKYKDGTPFDFYYIVADSDAWTPSRSTGKSTAVVFAEHDLAMRQADKDLENGWRRLHEWLSPFVGKDGQKTALLTFTRDCANTLRTYPACEQSKTNPEDIAKESEHHPQDVDRYFCMSRPMPLMLTEEEKFREDFDKDIRESDFDRDNPFN